jgi:hypothetical protein
LSLLVEQIKDQRKSIDWNGRPGHTQNTIEFGGEETDSVESGYLSEEGVFGGETGNPGSILSNESWNCSWTVCNVEMGAIVNVGRALGWVVIFMEVAGGWESAFLGGDPKVGWSSIEDDSELLRGSSDIDLSKWRQNYP